MKNITEKIVSTVVGFMVGSFIINMFDTPLTIIDNINLALLGVCLVVVLSIINMRKTSSTIVNNTKVIFTGVGFIVVLFTISMCDTHTTAINSTAEYRTDDMSTIVSSAAMYTPSPTLDDGVVKLSQSQDNTAMHTKAAMFIMQTNSDVYEDLANLYVEYFVNASECYDLKLEHLISIAKVESNFDRKAISTCNCIGIMQINPAIWLDILIDEELIHSMYDLYVPEKNIMAGAFIYRYYYDKALSLNKMRPTRYAVAKYVGTTEKYIQSNSKLADHNYYQKWKMAMQAFKQVDHTCQL